MPDKVTLKLFVFCALIVFQFNLKGQVLSRENSGNAETEQAPDGPGTWYFPYESLDKAIAANPAASERTISLEGPWKFSTDAKRFSPGFYTPEFDDASWETVKIPGESRATENGEIRTSENKAIGAAGNKDRSTAAASRDERAEVILFRKKINLDEIWAEKQLFISPGMHTATAIWVNGHRVGQTAAGSPKAEFNITPFLQPGENLLALELALGRGQGVGAGTTLVQDLLSGMVKGMLYSRPEMHFQGIGLTGSLDKNRRKGLLELDIRVENRMDSVKERFWGVLREPIYSEATVNAQLVDDEGNEIIDFRKDNTYKIRGGDRMAFHFEGTVDDVKPWSHETPYCYRLNITLLDGAGQVLEVVSQQVGFRTVEVEEEMLHVNGVPVPLRVFKPGPRPLFSMDREQLMQDIREIKQGNFNAVYASSYFTYPSWYRLCNLYGVYVLDKRVHGNKNNPSIISLSQKERLPEAGKPVVDLLLADFLKGTIGVRNHFAFRDLSGYYLQWEILRNGKKAEEGRVEQLPVASGQETGLSLGYKMRFYEGNDYFLNLRLKTKTGDSLVPPDFTVASRQFRLGPYHYEEEYQVDKGMIDVTDDPGSIVLNGYDFRIVFDKGKGQISRYSYKGRELMNEGPELNFRKLLVPQDSLKESHTLWNEAADKGNIIDYKVTEDVNGNYYISFTKVLLGGDARLFQKFRVDGRGAILVENVFVRMQGDYPLMPGFGTSFRLPGDYREMEWYGREPAAQNEIGIYSGPISANTGSDKRDVRWVRLSREDGYGLLIRKENQLLNLTAAREGAGDGPVLLSVDLAQQALPFKSRNFTYRIIPYISSANVQ
ncbi:glycosyl hydrolase family 2 [Anseongella ginsenosidimutans]|uniref:beta-galactosidase n=1 Tax=Anseongella ginsenosidimutans TaxID=496056 RepID=A0A4R3KVA7_9SPHI|nr:beta-galactosidase domain 4-containing protein [Anseongella ginsenosidimutans]QEC53409.1 DUF4981 domain-containing protein [Anseongella ginsenosidimutans]TCS88299.1 glycosyl hydrolase family 2 [Anseongella ginsenosidimutans]